MHACDALILPAVLGSPSQPLDVGRQERLVTPAILAALRLRDGGCSFPGCTMPAPFCDAHHLRHWSENGATSLVNMALLCRFHHRLIHRYRYFAITTINGVTWDLTRRYRDDDRATRKVG